MVLICLNCISVCLNGISVYLFQAIKYSQDRMIAYNSVSFYTGYGYAGYVILHKMPTLD